MNPITIECDLAVPMRDGVRLFANVYRPAVKGPPRSVIMSVTPYGKDKLPDRVANFFMRLSGVKFGKLNCSRLTGFESPDPEYWVRQDYAVLQADVRGMHKSEGRAGVLRQQDAEDYYDLIEWAASQPWCTGRVALMGVSYLCMSQWRVAALKPLGSWSGSTTIRLWPRNVWLRTTGLPPRDQTVGAPMRRKETSTLPSSPQPLNAAERSRRSGGTRVPHPNLASCASLGWGFSTTDSHQPTKKFQ